MLDAIIAANIPTYYKKKLEKGCDGTNVRCTAKLEAALADVGLTRCEFYRSISPGSRMIVRSHSDGREIVV